jgi:hypothetical protein
VGPVPELRSLALSQGAPDWGGGKLEAIGASPIPKSRVWGEFGPVFGRWGWILWPSLEEWRCEGLASLGPCRENLG